MVVQIAGGGAERSYDWPLKPGSARLAAFFGDIPGFAYALDASTGQLIWRSPADNHPLARVVGNPRLFEGRLYVPLASLEEDESRSPQHICCTFRGVVTAFDSETGKQVWKSYTIAQEPKVIKRNSIGVDYMGPSGAGVWTTPIIDTKRRALYFGTGNSFTEPARRHPTRSWRWTWIRGRSSGGNKPTRLTCGTAGACKPYQGARRRTSQDGEAAAGAAVSRLIQRITASRRRVRIGIIRHRPISLLCPMDAR